jgi:hypothetical protein
LTIGILAVGCQPAEEKKATNNTQASATVPPKPGAAASAQVKTMEPGLTEAGKTADSRIGSKAGGN